MFDYFRWLCQLRYWLKPGGSISGFSLF